jgi:enoyl-CoA hydratase/carnithine racemase
MLGEMISVFRELDQHERTVFTVLTGEGRFFSAGADIRRMCTVAAYSQKKKMRGLT